MDLISALAIHAFSANMNSKVFQESKVDTGKAFSDSHRNTRTTCSIVNSIRDEMEGLAFSYSLLSDLIPSRDMSFCDQSGCADFYSNSFVFLKCVTFLVLSRPQVVSLTWLPKLVYR